MVKWNLLKSGLQKSMAISGLMKSRTRPWTRPVNATPMTMPTARSTTLPRKMNWRNSVTRLRTMRLLSANRDSAVGYAARFSFLAAPAGACGWSASAAALALGFGVDLRARRMAMPASVISGRLRLHPAQHADQQTHRLVRQLDHRLLHHRNPR